MAKIIAGSPITFTIVMTPYADGTAEVKTHCEPPQVDVLAITQAMLGIIGTWLQQIQDGNRMLVGQGNHEKGEHSA